MAPRSQQQGSALVMTAIFATGLMITAGLVADVGSMLYQRSRMQVATDAAALAGARALPYGDAYAIDQAQEISAENGYKLPASDVSIVNGSRMTVKLERSSDSVVRKILTAVTGQENASPLTVGAQSTADLRYTQASPRPIGIPFCQFRPGAEYVLKQTSSVRTYFGLSADGMGAGVYRQEVLQGVQRSLAPGDVVPADLGSQSDLTVSALDQLIGNDQTSYREAMSGVPTPRVIILPTYVSWSYQSNEIANVVLYGFVRYYVAYTTSQGDVYGRFMDKLTAGAGGAGSPQYSVRLVDASAPLPPPFPPGLRG